MSKVKIEGNASGTGTLTIAAPNTNTDRTLTLPDGAGEILTDAAIGTSVLAPDGDGSSLTGITTGKVLQVVIDETYDTQSFNTSSYSKITLLTPSITPSSTSSKILVMANIQASTSGNAYLSYRLYRGGTSLQGGTAGSPGEETMFGGSPGVNGDYQIHQHTFQYLDSPSTTSATEYSIYVSPMRTSSYTWRLNRSNNEGDANQFHVAHSSIILMEIAG